MTQILLYIMYRVPGQIAKKNSLHWNNYYNIKIDKNTNKLIHYHINEFRV